VYASDIMHLLLPLLASVLFVCGLILIKRAGEHGVKTATILFISNQCSALLFSSLWWSGGTMQPWMLLWQPALIAVLFVLGLVFTYVAIDLGAVSIATPVFGVKVVFVAALLTLVGRQELPAALWYAAGCATAGIGLIQWTGRAEPRRVWFTITLALSAAGCYATFDVLVQQWAPAWGAGRFLPIVYWMVGLISLVLIPWVQWPTLREPTTRWSLLVGACLVSLQAVCIVYTLSVFGDAARVNIVYSLRGLWGVGFAWIAAKIWGGAESHLPRSVMLTRLAGAALLTTAVVLAIVFED
jgi:drug/metabolite transporter (DMT)-like permease